MATNPDAALKAQQDQEVLSKEEEMVYFPGIREAWRSGYVSMSHSETYYGYVPFDFTHVQVVLSYKGKSMPLSSYHGDSVDQIGDIKISKLNSKPLRR